MIGKDVVRGFAAHVRKLAAPYPGMVEEERLCRWRLRFGFFIIESGESHDTKAGTWTFIVALPMGVIDL